MRTRDIARFALPLALVGATSALVAQPATNPVGAPERGSIVSESERPPSNLFTDALDAQLAIIANTEQLLNDKIHVNSTRLRARVRHAYKLLRAGSAPLWSDGEHIATTARQRAGIRHILDRDTRELDLVRRELSQVHRARERLEAERERARAIRPPPPGSLFNPVAFSRVIHRFGGYRYGPSRVHLTRHGITLSSRPGRNVRAVADGTVVFTGHIRGLGHAVLIDHGTYFALLGELTADVVATGEQVTRQQIVGESVSDAVYLEIRMQVGAGGLPIDPVPLLQ